MVYLNKTLQKVMKLIPTGNMLQERVHYDSLEKIVPVQSNRVPNEAFEP